MKFLFLVIIALASQISYSQKVTAKKGNIKIEVVNHYFERNKESKLTIKISNRANRPCVVYYLDKEGMLLEKIFYGKQHNNNLKLIDNIKVYEYENENLKSMVEWESDYQKDIYPYWKTKYFYDTNNNLIEEIMYYAENDILFKTTKYEYDNNNNLTKTIFTSTHYSENIYDVNNKLIAYRDIYNNKLYWEYDYTYTDAIRLGKFQTHYDDGNYTKEEIRKYKDGKIIELEEKADSDHSLDNKVIYYYSQCGLVEKAEYYARSKIYEVYLLESYTIYKYNGVKNPDKELLKKINSGIFGLKP